MARGEDEEEEKEEEEEAFPRPLMMLLSSLGVRILF